MSNFQFEERQWQFRDGTGRETSAVFRGLLDGSVPRDSLCKSDADPEWRTAGSRFPIIGPYGILGELGEGGFGKVYRAFDSRRLKDGKPTRLVALKCPSDSLLERYARAAGRKTDTQLSTEEDRRKAREWARSTLGQVFSTETALTARLATCDNVVKVLDHDVTVPYMALEYCDGGSLADRMTRPYELAELISWGRQIAAALATAHGLQPDALVHRDLKPENVLVHEGRMKVSDFGTSQMIQQTSSLRSLRGGYTPAYAAPEAFYGKAYPGTDVWSLGVILYEMLASRRPFNGENMMQLGRAIDEARPPPLEEATTVAAPRPLITLVHSCLARDPEARPSAEIVRDCLAAFLDPNIASATLPELVIPSARPPARPSPGPSTVSEPLSHPVMPRAPIAAAPVVETVDGPPPASPAPPAPPAPPVKKGGRGLLIVLILLILGLLGGGAYALYGERIREAILGPAEPSPKEKAIAARSRWLETLKSFGALAPEPEEGALAEETHRKALASADPDEPGAAALFAKAEELFERCCAGYPEAARAVYDQRRDRILARGERAKEELGRWTELQAVQRQELNQAKLKLELARDMARPGTYRESSAYLGEAESIFEACLKAIAEAARTPLTAQRAEAEVACERYQGLAKRLEPTEATLGQAEKALAGLGQAAAFVEAGRYRQAIELYDQAARGFSAAAEALGGRLGAIAKARTEAEAAAAAARRAGEGWKSLAAGVEEPVRPARLAEAEERLAAGEAALKKESYAEASEAFKLAEAAFIDAVKEAEATLARRRALAAAGTRRGLAQKAQEAWQAAAARAPKAWPVPAAVKEAAAALAAGEKSMKAQDGAAAGAAFEQARALYEESREAAEAATREEERRRREAAEAKARRVRKILTDNTEWSTSTRAAQDEAIAVVAAKLGEAFKLIGSQEYRSGGQAHRIATFRHVASGCELNLIPGGRYTMGSNDEVTEKPAHSVDITGPFLIGKTEVSQEQWDRIGGEDIRNHTGPRLPIDSCSWVDAQKWLKKAGDGLRLPSEAEWEYAARAGTQTDYFFGNNLSELREHSWFAENARRKPHDIGLKKPNAFGLYDVLGNVMEWCQDGWIDNYQSGPKDQEPRGQKGASSYILRGGSWNLKNDNARVSARFWYGPANRYDFFGLRLARSIEL